MRGMHVINAVVMLIAILELRHTVPPGLGVVMTLLSITNFILLAAINFQKDLDE